MAHDAIDWDAAVRTGQQRAPRGPTVTAAEARQAVTDLRRMSAQAELRVRETTGLGIDLPVADAEVVDRRGWVAAAAEGMSVLAKPLTDQLPDAPSQRARSFAGQQVGLLLGYLSGRVLGQYDPIGGGGRLLLVAPNIIKVEREIDADGADFRLWVCLHESTHRLQFTAASWMTQYFRDLVDAYGTIAPTAVSQMLPRVVDAILHRGGPDHESWLQRIQTPEQRPIFDRLMALMTLLEGHADYVMDAVGPTVIPTVESIRESFSQRRAKGSGPVDRVVRTLLGMDAKLAQYVRGAAFVRAVVDRVGMSGLNAVFAAPEALPTLDEIAEPGAWVRRVHGE